MLRNPVAIDSNHHRNGGKTGRIYGRLPIER
jgi:hypothetical protein